MYAYSNNVCLADCGEDWTVEQIEAELWRGPHPSEYAYDAMKVLHEETRNKVSNGYAKVIWYGYFKNNLPEKLKISPVAMITNK